VITVEEVSYTYEHAGTPVLEGFTASFPAGSLTAVTGDNGCGKTTATKLIVGIERPTRGRILIDGLDTATLSVAEIAQRVGYLSQNPSRQLFCTSVLEEVTCGLRNLGLDEADAVERAQRYLDYFDLTGHSADFPLHLSHGEQQRLLLATVLAMEPVYLVLDEPSTGLDIVRQRALGSHLRTIVEDDGCGIIVVSHERGFVTRYADAEVRIEAAGQKGSPLPGTSQAPAPSARATSRLDLTGLDPRPKMTLTICLSTLAVIWGEPAWLAALLAATCAMLALGGIGLRAAFTQVRGLLGVLALLFAVQCIFVRRGDPLLSLAGFPLVTVDGVGVALSVTLRLVIIVFSALILLTGDARDYLLALVQCRVPYEVAFMVMTALHFLPILREETMDVYTAVQMRGTEVTKATLRDKLCVYRRIALPIVVGAIKRAEQVALAMDCRAFRSSPQRTFMRRLTLAPPDVAILIAAPALTVTSLIVSWTL